MGKGKEDQAVGKFKSPLSDQHACGLQLTKLHFSGSLTILYRRIGSRGTTFRGRNSWFFLERKGNEEVGLLFIVGTTFWATIHYTPTNLYALPFQELTILHNVTDFSPFRDSGPTKCAIGNLHRPEVGFPFATLYIMERH